MKKIRYFFATVLCSALFSITALAASAKISFSDPSVTLGSEVNVTMKIKSEDASLSRADITISYDTAALEFISGTDSDGGAGTVRIHGASNGEGTGTLEYNLKFKTLAAGTAAIRIGTQEVYDTDESLVEITHQGSSAVKISAGARASSDASLRELTVSPGTLSPAFSAENTSYEVIVGTDVNVLAINAIGTAEGSSVSISGNEALNIGENNVLITVTAADGTTQAVYTLKAIKQEGGPSASEQGGTQTTNEGVKLSAKEKTITIMNPGSDVSIPEGFVEGSINIDGHEVRGWVWKADTEHRYCIVYGMNAAGELNFYRYDLSEKTIQRYFEDPVAVQLKEDAGKYPELVERYDALIARYNRQFIISCVLGVLALFFAAALLLLSGRRRIAPPAKKKLREEKREGGSGKEEEHVFYAEEEKDSSSEDLGITRVISRASASLTEESGETEIPENGSLRRAAGSRPSETAAESSTDTVGEIEDIEDIEDIKESEDIEIEEL